MKKLLLSLALATSVPLASAAVIEDVVLDFESGATWTGTITFMDAYAGMLDAEGHLSGGLYNYNDLTTWSWWAGNGVGALDHNGDGSLDDWMMGPNLFIGVSWDAAASQAAGGLVLTLHADPYYSGVSPTNDSIVGLQRNPTGAPVPEASTTAALMMVGLAGLGLARGRLRRTAVARV